MLFVNRNLPPEKRIIMRQISDYIINVGLLSDSDGPFIEEFTSMLRESFRQGVETKVKTVFKEIMRKEPTCEEKRELFTTLATFLIDKSAGDPMEGVKVLKVINEDRIKEFVDALWVEPKGCSDREIADAYTEAVLKATGIVNDEIRKWVRENGLEKEFEVLKARAILINLSLGEKFLKAVSSRLEKKVPLVEKTLAKIKKWKSYYSSKIA